MGVDMTTQMQVNASNDETELNGAGTCTIKACTPGHKHDQGFDIRAPTPSRLIHTGTYTMKASIFGHTTRGRGGRKWVQAIVG
jgi:hypothetical protein